MTTHSQDLTELKNHHLELLGRFIDPSLAQAKSSQFCLDFIHNQPPQDDLTKKAIQNWGEGLHQYEEERQLPQEWHHKTFHDVLGHDLDLYRGKDILEIGCGEGIDSRNAANKFQGKDFVAIDIGPNILDLSRRDKDIKNLHYVRGNALQLPFKDNAFDSIVSYGVFHHTSSPIQCMHEAYRVLKPQGQLCLYLYKNHEDSFYKRVGVLFEKIIMKATRNFSISQGRILCWLLSPIVLTLFSWPAQILRHLFGMKDVADKLPFYWGTTPKSVVNDLQDRLFASINFRYSKDEFKKLFQDSGFKNIRIKTFSGGHCGVADK